MRGLATNVANYNAWSIGTCPSYTQGNTVCDEKKYINAIAPLLQNAGFPARFIIDTCESLLAYFFYPGSIQANINRLQPATASNPPSKTPGATGAMSSAPASASVSPPTQATRWPMRSFGSSPVARAMGRLIARPQDMMRIADTAILSSRRLKRERGSRYVCWWDDMVGMNAANVV